VIRCDNAGEYKALARRLYRKNRVTFKFTTLYILEQNRVVEQLNKTLITNIRAMLLETELSIEL
jgi:hypothetical protein